MQASSIPTIRPGRDADAAGMIALIGACWSQYPGVHMDVDGEMPELRALASYYAGKSGALWVAEANGQVAGMIATTPLGAGAWEICRVYASPSTHGAGLGASLLDRAEQHARSAGATRLALWSDTRFDRAHRFYEKRGYVRSGPIRVLQDISNSLEFGYAKPIDGIEVLDAAAAASAERGLGEILRACVEAGASVSYLPPLSLDTARGYWRRVIADVAADTHILVAAWSSGALAGTATLELCGAPNQPHRAEVHKLLVHPAARRRGIARRLMQRLEQEAFRAGRTLMVLDTREGDHAERLYHATGWQEAGRIPRFAMNADGSFSATVFFWKTPSQPTSAQSK